MEKKFNIGVIGAGMWGHKHIETLQRSGRAEVSWIAAKTEKTVSETKEKFKIPKGTTDYKDILKDPDVDAVIITSPPYTHAEIAIDTINAGKNFVLEKPMVIKRSEMKKLLALEKKTKNLVILEASCRHTRLQPKFEFIKNIIKSGKLGEIYYIHHNHLTQGTFVEYNPKGQWGMNKKFAGGGPFFDWGAYDLSFHLGLLDDKPCIKKVSSLFIRNDLRDLSSLVPVADVEQHGVAMLEFDTGLKYYYERGGGVHCETANETRIYGTKGGLKFSFPTWESNDVEFFYIDPQGRPVKEILKIPMQDYCNDDNVPFIDHFLDCLEKKAKPIMPLSLAAKHLDIIFRIFEN